MPISGCRTSVRLVLSFQAMAPLAGAASSYAATVQPSRPFPPIDVVSWNTGPAEARADGILGFIRSARVAEECDVILLQGSPGHWANPMTPEEVKALLHQVFPSDLWWILVLHHLVSVVRKALTVTSANLPVMPRQGEIRLFPQDSGKSRWWRFAQEVSCLGAEKLRCGAFACCVPCVCVCCCVLVCVWNPAIACCIRAFRSNT